jgi:hypothetical protein
VIPLVAPIVPRPSRERGEETGGVHPAHHNKREKGYMRGAMPVMKIAGELPEIILYSFEKNH